MTTYETACGIAGPEASVIQVIQTNILRRGKGVENDPVRVITQYWSLDGRLLAELDPYSPGSASGSQS